MEADDAVVNLVRTLVRTFNIKGNKQVFTMKYL